jgi:DUF1680 family protein
MDYYERNLVNHRLAPSGRRHEPVFHFADAGSWRPWGGETDTFWCCNGTAVEAYNKLTDTIYYNDGSNLWVNLFLPSSLDWKEQDLRLTPATRFRKKRAHHLTIEAAPAKALP